MDFQCDMDCPAKDERATCCRACRFSRLEYYEEHPELKDYWDKQDGFWSEAGCKLPRNLRPVECNEYDCKDRFWVVVKYYDHREGRWFECQSKETPKDIRKLQISGISYYTQELVDNLDRERLRKRKMQREVKNGSTGQ